MSLDAAYFDDIYARSDDPWSFRSRWYEKRKRAILLASLPRDRFDTAFEPGCSNGELTVELASRCNAVLATDSSRRAVALARQRVDHLPQVTVAQARIPDAWPELALDLIVLSEIVYYLDAATVATLAGRVRASLGPDGVVVACHWRHRVPDYPLDGDTVHRLLANELRLHSLSRHVETDFVLDVWSTQPQSVAEREGLT